LVFIVFYNVLGYPRGIYANIIGRGIASLYSTDIGGSTSTSIGGANISMEGSSGAGSIYSEGFTLQIGKARVKCLQSTEGSTSSSSLSSNAAAISLVSN
jgi:hypothetical protein